MIQKHKFFSEDLTITATFDTLLPQSQNKGSSRTSKTHQDQLKYADCETSSIARVYRSNKNSPETRI